MGSEFVRALDGEYTEAAQEEARSAHAAADARWDILPPYLRLALGEAPPPDTHQADMVAMKAREFEQVRFRSVPTEPRDVHLEATIAPMRNEILDCIDPPRGVDMDIMRIMDPASGLDPFAFIDKAHRRSLGVHSLKKDSSSRVGYVDPPALLSAFPAIAESKLGAQLSTEQGRARAIGQLVAKHAGEVVDFDSNMTCWTLRPKSGPGAASSDSEPVHPQLVCVDGGGAVGHDDLGEYGRGALETHLRDRDTQARAVAKYLGDVSPGDLLPDWRAQVSRVVAPCVNNQSHQWHRAGPITTLGEMFMVLGKTYTAKAI